MNQSWGRSMVRPKIHLFRNAGDHAVDRKIIWQGISELVYRLQ
jgi:hypothetical protein